MRQDALFGGLAKLLARRQRVVTSAVQKFTRLQLASAWVVSFTGQQPLLRTGPLWGELMPLMVRYADTQIEGEGSAPRETRNTSPKPALARAQMPPARQTRSASAGSPLDRAWDEKTLVNSELDRRPRLHSLKTDFTPGESSGGSNVRPLPRTASQASRERLRKWAGHQGVIALPDGLRRGIHQLPGLPARIRVSPPANQPQQQSDWRQQLVTRIDKNLRVEMQSLLAFVQPRGGAAVELSTTRPALAAIPETDPAWRRAIAGPRAPRQLLVALAASGDPLPTTIAGADRQPAGSLTSSASQPARVHSNPVRANPTARHASPVHLARQGQQATPQPDQPDRHSTQLSVAEPPGKRLANDAQPSFGAVAEVDRDHAALELAAQSDGARWFAPAAWGQAADPPLLDAASPSEMAGGDRFQRDRELAAMAGPGTMRRTTPPMTQGQQEWELHQLAAQMKRILDAEARRHGIDV
jgi:hypothetical protein